MNIGVNLKNLRENRGLTQKELAEKSNVTQSMIAQLERGTKTLTVPLCMEIAAVLDCGIGEILGGNK